MDPNLLISGTTDRRLHLILMPTEACNFRCVYCYEEFKYKRMEPGVVLGVKRLLEQRAALGLTRLDLSWFGGEPLLARDIMEEIMQHAQGLARRHPKMTVTADVTTNAYLLTRDVFDRLQELGVGSYQISFDGPREHHDKKRVLAGGKGTFDRVWGNMVALRDAPGGFRVLVRVHADQENKDALPRFIDQYKDVFGDDPRFELFVRPLSRLGGPNDSKLSILEEDSSNRVTAALRQYASDRGIKQGPITSGPAVCYAAMGNSFLIRANGRLNKCTVALEHPNNQIGRISPEGTLEIDSPKALHWVRGLRSGDEAELACPMLGFAQPTPNAVPREDIALSIGSSQRV